MSKFLARFTQHNILGANAHLYGLKDINNDYIFAWGLLLVFLVNLIPGGTEAIMEGIE